MTTAREPADWHLDTIAVHGGYRPDPTTRAAAVPIYQTAAFAFDDTQHGADLFDLKVPGNIYTRIMNPTQDVLEQRLALLEGGVGALALASGQAAVTYAILTIAEAGDNLVSSSTLYGGTYNLLAHTLPQYGIGTRFADPREPDSFAALIDARTKAIFVESVGNPLGNITDIAALAPELDAIEQLSRRHEVSGVTAVAPGRHGTADFELRSFGPAIGVDEDAACGGGNACAAAMLAVKGRWPARGGMVATASQGRHLGRDASLFWRRAEDGPRFEIGGHAVLVSRGSLSL
ncbi:PLP-dependent transferase [Burkholderia gladioli]|uniref:PLP-dependent transferase n=1 Tax=Burkholderia gladioli TaxID=28095 RepID=UPI001640F74D|nr:PLP-dependent transferase [Burkholderia gladioli]